MVWQIVVDDIGFFVEQNDARPSDKQRITCRPCGMTSYHPQDVKSRFCGNCNIFHSDFNLPEDVADE